MSWIRNTGQETKTVIGSGTIDAPGEAAEESLECVVVKEPDWPLLTPLFPALPTIPVVRGLLRTQSVKPINIWLLMGKERFSTGNIIKKKTTIMLKI